MLLQMPAFFILYSVIRGITNTVTVPAHTVDGLHVAATVTAIPRYIPHDSAMYHNIRDHHGQLISFGMDFSEKLLSHHSTWYVAIPYLLLVVGAVGLQYLQMSRLNARNSSAAQANPQAAMLQKYMPLIFGFIYLNVAAILNVYFIVSSAIRILTQEILFRKGIVGGPPPAPTAGEKPSGSKGAVADRTERAIPRPKASGSTTKGGSTGSSSNGSQSEGTAKQWPRPAVKGAIEADAVEKSVAKKTTAKPATRSTSAQKRPNSSTGSTNGGRNGSGGSTAKASTNGSNGTGTSGESGSDKPKEHPRSKDKRDRKAR
jgi:hypothetical protein